jgi:hypothetical protein
VSATVKQTTEDPGTAKSSRLKRAFSWLYLWCIWRPAKAAKRAFGWPFLWLLRRLIGWPRYLARPENDFSDGVFFGATQALAFTSWAYLRYRFEAPATSQQASATQYALAATAECAAALMLVSFLASLAALPWAKDLWGDAFAGTLSRRRAVSMTVGAAAVAVVAPLYLLGSDIPLRFGWVVILPQLVCVAFHAAWLARLADVDTVIDTIDDLLDPRPPAGTLAPSSLFQAVHLARSALDRASERGDSASADLLCQPLWRHTQDFLLASDRAAATEPTASQLWYTFHLVAARVGIRTGNGDPSPLADLGETVRLTTGVDLIGAWASYAKRVLSRLAGEPSTFSYTLRSSVLQGLDACQSPTAWFWVWFWLLFVFHDAEVALDDAPPDKRGELSNKREAVQAWTLERIEERRSSLGDHVADLFRGAVNRPASGNATLKPEELADLLARAIHDANPPTATS